MSKKMMVCIGAVVYVCSPLDIIPDVIPILGWMDDGGVIVGTIAYLMRAEKKPQPAGKEVPAK